MKLPEPIYTPESKKTIINSFGGINKGSTAAENQIESGKNLCFEDYPALSVGKPWRVTSCQGGESVFSWNGKLVVCRNGALYYDGEELCSVTRGRKQFAVVNTRLIVWPDKIYIDLTERTAKRLDVSVTSAAGSTNIFTTSTLQLGSGASYGYRTETFYNGNKKVGSYNGTTYTEEIYSVASYMKTYTALSWNGSAWTGTGEAERILNNVTSGMLVKFQSASTSSTDAWLLNKKTITAKGSTIIQTDDYKTDRGAFYARIERVTKTASADGLGYYYEIYYEVVSATGESEPLSDIFNVGDCVNITRAPAFCDAAAENMILSIDDAARTLTFAEGTFRKAGNTTNRITVKRPVPDMDYICAHKNRLYGVNSEKRTIYVSALGLPWAFTDYEGTGTDSFTVAEASNGDFTACCEYGSYVFFFKEHRVIKFFGDTPSAMGYATEEIEGVKRGCERSLCLLNDVLYYMGVHGYYAYGGSVPSLLSEPLGITIFSNASAATDGEDIYLDIPNVGAYLFSTVYKAWLPAALFSVQDMCRFNGEILILTADGQLMSRNLASYSVTRNQPWQLKFNYNDYSKYSKYVSLGFEAKDMRHLRIYAEKIDSTATVKVVVTGSSASRILAEKTFTLAAGKNRLSIALPPQRETGFLVVLSGTGRCRITALEKEFIIGSDYK